MKQAELNKYFLEAIERGIEEKNEGFIKDSLEGLHPIDINKILYELDTAESKYVIDLLDVEVSAEILEELEVDVRSKFLTHFTPKELAHYINHIDSDNATDILNEQARQVREKVLPLLDEEKAGYILDLLKYDEDTAGGLMEKEFIIAQFNWTTLQCIEEIRRQKEKVEKVFSVYVVDEQQHLVGRISLKRLILAPDDSIISDLMEDVIHVDAFMEEEEVAKLMSKYDLVAVPVVNMKKKLIGRITIDDIVDVITEQAELDQQAMSGISEDVDDSDTVWTLTRARLPWLIVGMLGGILGAQLIGLFEGAIRVVPAMAFFIPLITATGGNVGIQSSTIIIQSLANDSIMPNDLLSRTMKSLFVAILNGLVIGGMVFCFNFFFVEISLAFAVAIALFSVVILASLTGTLTPIILDKLNVNPALASGPFITTANDLLGIGVYFLVAYLLIL
ncbi:MAG: magnesium transporter [Cytophagales bacterium]|nr:magnesium transporter [Cytophagales bacterium]